LIAWIMRYNIRITSFVRREWYVNETPPPTLLPAKGN
jgi:hypothetical protein